jgi:hypothetical protein
LRSHTVRRTARCGDGLVVMMCSSSSASYSKLSSYARDALGLVARCTIWRCSSRSFHVVRAGAIAGTCRWHRAIQIAAVSRGGGAPTLIVTELGPGAAYGLAAQQVVGREEREDARADLGREKLRLARRRGRRRQHRHPPQQCPSGACLICGRGCGAPLPLECPVAHAPSRGSDHSSSDTRSGVREHGSERPTSPVVLGQAEKFSP